MNALAVKSHEIFNCIDFHQDCLRWIVGSREQQRTRQRCGRRQRHAKKGSRVHEWHPVTARTRETSTPCRRTRHCARRNRGANFTHICRRHREA
jgi:hypothetical protein